MGKRTFVLPTYLIAKLYTMKRGFNIYNIESSWGATWLIEQAFKNVIYYERRFFYILMANI